jgi:hypothetical protein
MSAREQELLKNYAENCDASELEDHWATVFDVDVDAMKDVVLAGATGHEKDKDFLEQLELLTHLPGRYVEVA